MKHVGIVPVPVVGLYATASFCCASLALLHGSGSGGDRKWSRGGIILVLAGHVLNFHINWLPKGFGQWETHLEAGGQEEE